MPQIKIAVGSVARALAVEKLITIRHMLVLLLETNSDPK